MAQPLKDMVDRGVVEEIAARSRRAAPGFDAAAFVDDVMDGLGDLELKERFDAIARRLRLGLGGGYRDALAVVVAVARQEPAIEGFAAWPLCTFVEVFGGDDPDASLPAMEHLTKRVSCEFAVRPLLINHWEPTYETLLAFTAHEDEAVRRLPSEGTRPRLPWAMRVPRLIEDPQPGIALLGRLRHDPSETVRRSVANHLNDVAKDHPEIVLAAARQWAAEQATDRRMLAHALRTLVKRGDPGALDLLGFTTDAEVRVDDFSVTPATVTMGDRIELTATLRSTAKAAQHLVVDFVIHHVTAAGRLSPKVFKWATVDLGPGEVRTLTKRRLIQMASTRTYYPGSHRVELQVAGRTAAESVFEVAV